MLVNKLKGDSEDPLPYAFYLVPRVREEVPGSVTNTYPARVQINKSILDDALAPKESTSTAPTFSPEDVFELWCEPQAVFRVRSVGRCSATLSGEFVTRAGVLCLWLI